MATAGGAGDGSAAREGEREKREEVAKKVTVTVYRAEAKNGDKKR